MSNPLPLPSTTRSDNVRILDSARSPGAVRPRVPSGILVLLLAALVVGVIYDREGEPLPLPENGFATLERALAPQEPTAPLTVVTNPDNRDTNYYVNVSDWETKAPVATMFVRAGQAGKMLLPLGEYRITYAAGTTWHGPAKLFGFKTSVSEGVTASRFYQAGAKGTVGHTLTFEPKVGGNFPVVPAFRTAFARPGQ